MTASSLEMRPSFSISMAMCSAAAAVRLPTRVCSMYSLPCSMVNSMSLHIAEVILEDDEDLLELLAGLFKALDVLQLGDGAGVADAGHDVLALGVDQVARPSELLLRRWRGRA